MDGLETRYSNPLPEILKVSDYHEEETFQEHHPVVESRLDQSTKRSQILGLFALCCIIALATALGVLLRTQKTNEVESVSFPYNFQTSSMCSVETKALQLLSRLYLRLQLGLPQLQPQVTCLSNAA